MLISYYKMVQPKYLAYDDYTHMRGKECIQNRTVVYFSGYDKETDWLFIT